MNSSRVGSNIGQSGMSRKNSFCLEDRSCGFVSVTSSDFSEETSSNILGALIDVIFSVLGKTLHSSFP